MKHKFKEMQIELHIDNLGKHHIRIDNVINGQYFNLLSTDCKVQAAIFYQDLFDLMKKHQEK